MLVLLLQLLLLWWWGPDLLLELGTAPGLLVDWCLLLGIPGNSVKTPVLWDHETDALTISYGYAFGTNSDPPPFLMGFDCSLLGRQTWDCILMTPGKTRVSDRHVWFDLWTCTHNLSHSDIFKLVDQRDSGRCL